MNATARKTRSKADATPAPIWPRVVRYDRDVWATIDDIRAGLPFARVERFVRSSAIPASTVHRFLGLPPRTLARRRNARRLSSNESERLIRLERVFALAVELFEGDSPAAREWLSSPKRALGRRVPLDVADTELGAREVENLIGRIEHGVFT